MNREELIARVVCRAPEFVVQGGFLSLPSQPKPRGFHDA
jgi:hypothetical protein